MVFFVPVLWNQYSDIVSAEAGLWGFSIIRVHLSFKLRGLENTILARVLFLVQERTWERPLEPFWIPLSVSVHKSITYMKSEHQWTTSSPCRSLLRSARRRSWKFFIDVSISCYRYVILLQTETQRGLQKGSRGRSQVLSWSKIKPEQELCFQGLVV